MHSEGKKVEVFSKLQQVNLAGSIPGTSTNFKRGLGLERGPPSQLLDWEVADLIKKLDIIRLDGA